MGHSRRLHHRHQRRSKTSPAVSDKEEHFNQLFALRHKALRNALYHAARRQWLEGWSRFFNFCVIVLSASATVAIIEQVEFVNVALPLITTAVGAIQLVYDFSGKAKDHAFLQSRYYGVMASIDECVDISEQMCANWEAEFSRVAADAPPTMRALDAVCDNQATSTLLGGGPRLNVTKWQWATRNYLPHNTGTFEPRGDWKPLPAPS